MATKKTTKKSTTKPVKKAVMDHKVVKVKVTPAIRAQLHALLGQSLANTGLPREIIAYLAYYDPPGVCEVHYKKA